MQNALFVELLSVTEKGLNIADLGVQIFLLFVCVSRTSSSPEAVATWIFRSLIYHPYVLNIHQMGKGKK
jgi:hypothetical protein